MVNPHELRFLAGFWGGAALLALVAFSPMSEAKAVAMAALFVIGVVVVAGLMFMAALWGISHLSD